jgi:hypothetical protein
MKESDNISLQRDIRRAFFRRIAIYVVVILALVIFATFVFHQFKIYSNARLKLREAKNIKMSLEMVNTEYYALGLSIFDETEKGNIRKGAYAYVERIQGDLEGTIKLTGYDSSKRIITGLEYETEEYIVRYTKNDENGEWKVCLIKELLTY